MVAVADKEKEKVNRDLIPIDREKGLFKISLVRPDITIGVRWGVGLLSYIWVVG